MPVKQQIAPNLEHLEQWALTANQLGVVERAYDKAKNSDPVAEEWRKFDVNNDNQLGTDDVRQLLKEGKTDTIEALKNYLLDANTRLNDSSIKNTVENLQKLAEENQPLNLDLSHFANAAQTQLAKMNWGGVPAKVALSTLGLALLERPEVSPQQRTAYHKTLNTVIVAVAAQVKAGRADPATLEALRNLCSKFEEKFPAHSNRFEGFNVQALTQQLNSDDPNVRTNAQQQLRSLYGVANEALDEATQKGDQAGADKARAKLNEIFSSIVGIDPAKLPPELKTAALSVAYNTDPHSQEGQLLAKFDRVGGDHKITPADLALMSSAELSELAGLLKPDANGNRPLSPETTKQLFHLLASYANDSKNNFTNKSELSANSQGSPPKVVSLSFKGADGNMVTIDPPAGPTNIWELPSGIAGGQPSPTTEELLTSLPV